MTKKTTKKTSFKLKPASEEIIDTMQNYCKANVNVNVKDDVKAKACENATKNLKAYIIDGEETTFLTGEAVIEIAKSELFFKQERERIKKEKKKK